MGIIKSAGLAIVYQKKLLILHPTNHRWNDGYSIPKGKLEKGEEPIDAAIRETYEEAGIQVPRELVGDEGVVIVYRKGKESKGKSYKRVHWFRVDIEDLSQLGIDSEILDQENLSLREVDWGGFIGGSELREKIFWRFLPIVSALEI